MSWLFSDNGYSFQGAFPDQAAGEGEVIFDEFPSEEQLLLAFPGRSAALLSNAKAAKYIVLTNAAQEAIIGSFKSAALGSSYTYPSLPTDQSNLHTGGLSIPVDSTAWAWKLWCTDGTTWDFVEHTAAELKKVIADYAEGLQGFQTHWASVVTLLNTALTLEDIAAISW